MCRNKVDVKDKKYIEIDRLGTFALKHLSAKSTFEDELNEFVDDQRFNTGEDYCRVNVNNELDISLIEMLFLFF